MNGLLLSLGHGSSAVLIINNTIVNGYQNERISGIKGDSSFPMDAIEEIKRYTAIPKHIPIFISHWEPFGNVDNLSPKYYNREYIDKYFDCSRVISCNRIFTHHDAHAFSTLAYTQLKNDHHIIVADGFGNFGEVLSIYKVDRTPKLIHRSYGYKGSLGLLYQYATDFVGLRMNQDEWKLNAVACDVIESDMDLIEKISNEITQDLLVTQSVTTLEDPSDPLFNLGALSNVHKHIHDILGSNFDPKDKPSIAYFLQCTVQNVILHWIQKFDMKDVVLVGGCFMNVQLNGHILHNNTYNTSVMPLSGDCGAPLGLYKRYHPSFELPMDLCWGKRNIEIFDDFDNLFFSNNLISDLIKFLEMDYIVNVVRGKMEFGERAYCNTSTLALPTIANRVYINTLNSRSQLMPMCPVIRRDKVKEYFQDSDKAIKSIEHMIMTLRYTDKLKENQYGVAHSLVDGTLTGRPQVIDEDHYMWGVLEKNDLLINTSFNNHGKPICYTDKDVVRTHINMSNNDFEQRMITIIGVKK